MDLIQNKDYKGKKVLVGVDWNVPLKDGQVADATRIERTKETILELSDKRAKVIILSHWGRPKGERVPEMSLKPAAEKASEIFGKEVKFADDCVGDSVKSRIDTMANGDILLLENVRYHIEETDYKKNPDKEENVAFAKELASLVDEFVEDAFARCHRNAVSTVGVVKAGNMSGAVGYLVQNEIKNLSKLFESPKDHYYAIVGGAKVSDKVDILMSLLDVANKILIGGAMAYPFLKSMGKNVGNSKLAEDDIPIAKDILEKAKEKDVEILLPIDHTIGDKFAEDATFNVTVDDNIPEGMLGLDIGLKTIEKYKESISDGKTIFWNGPMGVFEFEGTSKGTFAVADALVKTDAFTVVGGGDSVSAIKKSGHFDDVSFISTAGGASLEFIQKRGKLPGLVVIGFEGV